MPNVSTFSSDKTNIPGALSFWRRIETQTSLDILLYIDKVLFPDALGRGLALCETKSLIRIIRWVCYIRCFLKA